MKSIEEILYNYCSADCFDNKEKAVKELKARDAELIREFVSYCWKQDTITGTAHDELAEEFIKSLEERHESI